MADGCCQAAHKKWETMSGMILNRLHPKFAAKSVANEMQYLKAMLWPALTGQTSIFDFQFFQQSDFVDNHLVCYWPTIHSLILKICPTFQVLSSHFFKVDKLLDEHWAKLVLSENISTPIYVECYRMYQSKVCVQEFWYFVPGLDIQPEKSKNNNPPCKKAVTGC